MKRSITQTVIDAYAGFFERHSLLVLIFVLATTLISGYGLTRLRFDDDIVSLLMEKNEGDAAENADIQSRTDHALLVMLEADEIFTPEALQVLWKVTEGIKEVDGVVGVASLYDLRTPKKIGRRTTVSRVMPPPDADLERISRAREIAVNHPMARQQLISEDGKEALIALELDPQVLSSQQIRPVLDQINEILSDATKETSVQATLTGVPAIRIEMADATIRDELIFNIAGPLVAVLIAFLIFRRVASVFIVVIGALMGVVWTIGILGLLGVTINPINAVVSPLALTIGLTDCVHMLLHVREHRARGDGRRPAVVKSIPTVGFPSALTSITSAVGFVSLGIAELDVLAKFGLCSALAVVVVFVSVMTIVPLLAGSFLGDYLVSAKQAPEELSQSRSHWCTQLVSFIVDHRVAALIGSLLITAGALYVGVQVQTDPRVVNGLPTEGTTRKALLKIEEQFGGTLPLVTTVRWDADSPPTAEEIYLAIADAHSVLSDRAITGPPLSLVNLYEALPERDHTPKALFQMLAKVPEKERKTVFDTELGRSLILSRCEDAGGLPIDGLLTDLEHDFAELENEHPGFRFQIAQTSIQGIRNANQIVADLIKSMLLAIPLTLGVVMLALQSFKAGVIAFLPNVFPMAALAATMVIAGQTITLTGAAVFVMCFGIAVDDTIHTITSFNKKLLAGQSRRDAIVNTYTELGGAVLSTTAILCGGLGVVMLGASYFTRMFGVMFCIGLIWALIGDLFMLPAILACYPDGADEPSENSG